MSRRVYVHVGAPKTGTTYLQDRLARNLRSLAGHDVHIPSRVPLMSTGMFHFRAALDLMGQDWGGAPGHAEGAWEAMVRRVRRANGTSIISHEILAPAEPEHVARLKQDLGGADTEIHIVYSARDLTRQVPAGWQESVKQGRRWKYGRYLSRIRSGKPWFARAFDLPTVLATWGNGLSPDRVHVVTVPQTAEAERDPDLLWRRFCTAFAIEEQWAPEDSERANASLGSAETQVLRALNERIGRSTRENPHYDALILGMLADETLGGRRSRPILLPPTMTDWARERGEAWTEWLEQSGVDVVGDLADLLPEPLAEGEKYRHPDRVSSKAQLRAALDALAAMTQEAASRPDPDSSMLARIRRAREGSTR
ncbi:MAG TPA: hypothetical protein VHW64_16075 [Nocardioides sp.]|jgi:hypothetical protein|uniref:hypothetical protein n=1 Tax=Nocardioides sp. TaxID=35761 RepID=UPI002E35F330|nr:hypothetical protein [Nocardioides sp.]HEX3932219.1 hypothetical protein [Nocardioides sp.]